MQGSNTTTVLEPLLLYIIYNVHSPEFVAHAGGLTCCVAIAENNTELSETKPTEPLFLKNSCALRTESPVPGPGIQSKPEMSLSLVGAPLFASPAAET